MFLGEEKGLGRVMQFVQLETKSSFSPTPSGKATWPEPRNTFRKTNVKGRNQGHPSLLSPGCSSRPHSMATCQADRQAATWEHPFPLPLGKQKNFPVFGEYFRNSNERDLFLLLAHGAEKGLLSSWVRENTGTPERSAFPRLGTPPGLQQHVHITCTASGPAHRVPTPDSSPLED